MILVQWVSEHKVHNMSGGMTEQVSDRVFLHIDLNSAVHFLLIYDGAGWADRYSDWVPGVDCAISKLGFDCLLQVSVDRMISATAKSKAKRTSSTDWVLWLVLC